jgi:flagellar biosynthesis/type III secretory pathway protein FliH
MTAASFYCFPDLAPQAGRSAAAPARSAPAFQRVAPGAAAGASCLPAAGGIDLGRPAGLRGVPVEEVERAAYCRGLADGERSGFEQGERAGGEAVRRQLESMLQSLRQMLEELEALRRREARSFEKELVELVLAVARKVIAQEVVAQPESVMRLLREALRRIEHGGPLTIRMNPLDLERLAGQQPQLLESLVDPGQVRFEADSGVSAGGCVIESAAGDIDGRLENRLRIVEEAMRAEARMHAGVQEPPE